MQIIQMMLSVMQNLCISWKKMDNQKVYYHYLKLQQKLLFMKLGLLQILTLYFLCHHFKFLFFKILLL